MKNPHQQRGVSLIIALLVMILMLAAVLGLSTLLASQAHVVFNISGSERASYAADAGIEKTLYHDKKDIPNGATEGLCNLCNSCTDCGSCQAIPLQPNGCDVNTCNNCQITYTTALPGVGGSFAVTATVTPTSTSDNKVCVESDGTYVNLSQTRKVCYTVTTANCSPCPADHYYEPAAGGLCCPTFGLSACIPANTNCNNPSVSTVSASYDNSSGNTTLTGYLNNLSSGTAQVYFAWSVAVNGDLQDPTLTAKQTMTASGSFSGTIDSSSLAPDTTYAYQARADYNGNTLEGGVQLFTTPGSPPPVAVTTGSADGITASDATLHGTLSNLPGGNSAKVYFAWSDTLSADGTLSGPTDTSQQDMGSSGNFNVNLSSLSSDTTYYYQALADYNSTTLRGSVESFTTLSPVQVVTGGAFVDGSAHLKGSLNNLPIGGSAQVYFNWGTSSTNLSNATGQEQMTASGNFSISTGQLPSANATYYYQAVAIYNGQTLTGIVKSFTADCNVTFNNPTASHIQDYQAVLSDAISGSGNCGYMNLSIVYGVTNPPPSGTSNQAASTTWFTSDSYNNPFSYTIGGGLYFGSSPDQYTGEIYELTPSTAYYYQVKVSYFGNLTWTSPVQSFTTLSSSDSGVQVFNGGYTCVYNQSSGNYDATLNGSIKNIPTGSSAPVSFAWGAGYTPGNLTNSTSPRQITQSGNFSATITGLTANNPYAYQSNSSYQGETLIGRIGQPSGYILTCP